MNLNLKPALLAAAFAAALASSSAQQSDTQSRLAFGTPGPESPGLIGQKSSSLDAAYIRGREGLPRIVHSYGVNWNSPISDSLDTALSYHFMTGNTEADGRYRQHEAMVSARAFFPLAWAKPFGEVGGGWTWTRLGAVNSDAFAYRVMAGLELGAPVPFALTPYVGYERTRGYRERLWVYGAKATLLLHEGMSATLGASTDENSTAEYRFALNINF